MRTRTSSASRWSRRPLLAGFSALARTHINKRVAIWNRATLNRVAEGWV